MIKNLNETEFSQKMERCGKYIEALEEERRKIRVFQRELPLCLDLVTQAIQACRRELSGTTTEYVHGQSECSEQTTGECAPILEEFIPIKRASSSAEEEDEDDADEQESHESDEKFQDKSTKSDWLRSVQLWNQSPDPPRQEQPPEKEMADEANRSDGTFQPNQAEKSASVKIDGNENTKSPATGDGGRKKEVEKDGGHRKQRRCWSQELHRRFLNALQQLGGAQVATPKQIRELMEVDGLTNDEVKSHLQKYRLHTRRLPSQTVPNNGNPLTPNFVVVGGIWVPQTDYSTADAAAAVARTYGRAVVAPPSTTQLQWPNQTKFKSLIPEERSRRRCHINADGATRCYSPATSSSARNGKKC